METIISSFQEWVNRMPDETAIVFEGRSWTYRELDLQSDRIAALLSARHVAGRQVGTAMNRGQEWIVALLGIWKAGAVYVPLDLNHPCERLELIIKDCEISLVICSCGGGFKPRITPFCYLEDLSSSDGDTLSLPLPRENDRAYIIYTSGTSGEPKGIPASHRQAARMSRIARDKYFYVHAGDRMLQLAGLNFSASLVEILTALLNGVCLVIAGDKERQDPRLLIALIEREHVVSAIIPPALLAVFPKVPIAGLETLLVAGEGVAADVKNYWMKGRRMVNAYGFTENTVLVMSGVYQEDTSANDIGTLVPDSVAYVLDEEGKPVPDGMSGELCIGGSQLTEGYWKRPQLNARKFIRNPFLTDGERRAGRNLHLFRSGDKVMRLPDGHFLYLGRLDNQVKIRGMRIELSEVEQCLNRYPGVSMSVVQAKEQRGRKVLIAYLQASREVDREKIKIFMAEKLPYYMCPAYYVTLQEFPMTINRKIDKARLPEPDWKHSGEWKDEPVTPAEKEIAQIWCDMLGVSVAGRYDNFVSLGGDSISVLLLTNVLEEKFGISLKAEDVFARLDLNVLAQFVEQLKSEKQHVIRKVSHKDVYDYCPLSPALRNLWGQCVCSPEVNESYKLALFLPRGNDLKVDAFQQAWNRMVQEQEVMRMTFPLNADGEPYAHVTPFVYADVPVQHVGEDEFWKEAYELYSPSFLLEKGPLHRACIYHYPDGRYMLVVIIHHLVTDGWSARLLDEKLQDYYLQYLQGNCSPVDGCSYRDYMVWSREQPGNDLKEERKSFWQKYLSGSTSLSFEGKVTRGDSVKKQGGAKYIPMDRVLGGQLEFFCERYAVTPLAACLSVFQLILSKYTGKSDFLVGIAATDRKRSEFRELLGYFATLLPVRVTKIKEESFARCTQMLMKETITLLSQSLPLNLIVESLGENAGRSVQSPFIRFAFGVEEVPSEMDAPEEWITSSPFDMALIIHKYRRNYSFHFQYATACFDDKFIIQFCESFQVALRFLLRDPSCIMEECPLLSPEEINKRISPFQFSELVLPGQSVVEQFEEIASGTPHREAYCWADVRMSYGELKRASDALAADIRERFQLLGDKQLGMRVGIYLSEKKYLLPVMLGVLKSGGCYVPLDRALPEERLAFILKDAGISLLLVDEIPFFHLPCETLLIRHSIEKKLPVDFHLSSLAPEDTAYIIYTSGTTGKPKGTPISHRSLALFARSQAEVYRLLPDKRVLQYASIGFDASVMEIFPALISKASLVIPTDEERIDTRLLLDLMEREKVYCTLLPPALLSILPFRSLPSLETLVVGGESTPGDVMERWMQGRRFVNAYGPTENTVVTTCSEVSGDFLPNDIGVPLPGVSCYVLSESMTLLPDYVPGELYIGGLQLTEGYIHRPALNREKFVTNPFVCPEDKKMGRNTILYKSGDKVMRTSEGSFLFLGRMDSQVKVRGFRIEPDEIARQLEEYPGILHAIVLLKDCGEKKRLAAYLLANKEVELTGVRNFLASRLPAYMIPSVWAVVEAFPLTLNGKVDRKALPEPSLLVGEAYEPPATRDEEVLARIAAELLQLSRMGVCTNLLDLGLTSLQAMELVHDARQKKVDVSVTDIYKGKCIRSILAAKENSLYYWRNDQDSGKPIVILVCGYPYFKLFYDQLVERFKDDFSFFVFESFFQYFQEKEEVRADDLMNHYCNVLQTELRGEEIYAVAGHCLGGELGMLLAERLRTNGHPSVKALIIEGFLRRDKSLLLPENISEEVLQQQARITNALVKSMPEPSFGGEMIVCLATKGTDRFMFETPQTDSDRLIREMKAASEKNRADWARLYPEIICHMLDTDHWSVFDDEPLTALYQIVKTNWINHH